MSTFHGDHLDDVYVTKLGDGKDFLREFSRGMEDKHSTLQQNTTE